MAATPFANVRILDGLADQLSGPPWHTPAVVLRMGTSANAEVLALSGARSPYAGRLGVVPGGALADPLLVDGDPLADIALIARPDEAFGATMKDGVLLKHPGGPGCHP